MRSSKIVALGLLFASLAVAGGASADPFQGRKRADIVGVSTVVPNLGTVEVKAPECPEGAICEAVTEVTLVFPLAGCVDRLGPVFYEVRTDAETGKVILAVSSTNLHTEGSMVTRCFVAPTAVRKLVLPMMFLTAADIEIVALNTL